MPRVGDRDSWSQMLKETKAEKGLYLCEEEVNWALASNFSVNLFCCFLLFIIFGIKENRINEQIPSQRKHSESLYLIR